MINLNDHKHIHCIGIGGIGLSGIAEILLARGYKVSGSDMKESEITEALSAGGATIYTGHRAENVEDADLVVYSAAIADENPEIQRAKELGIPTASRAEILGILMDEYKKSIAISGTHGKTTTTSMVSLILERADFDPTVLVGGNMAEFGGNYKVGESEFFVSEACEYMDSFLELRPEVEIILNIDSDHLDYFKDLDHIVNSFDRFTANLRPNGIIVAYDANPFVQQVIKGMPNVVKFGYASESNYHVGEVHFGQDGMPTFEITHGDNPPWKITLKVPGEHNILNAAASFACCHQLGVDPEVIVETLGEFGGTKRRFDIIGKTKKGVLLVDDYAHHPTEIKATLSASANIPHNRVWCLFQPHTYTRTLALFDEFAEAFEQADVLILADVYAAREQNVYNFSSETLAKKIKETHPDKEIHYISTMEEMAEKVLNEAKEGDLVITMGAGDIYRAGEIIMEKEQ